MKHFAFILIKLILISVILEIVFGFVTVLDFGRILLASFVVTIVAYILGDVLILPRSNNIVATISDVVLAFITLYILNYIPNFGVIELSDAALGAILIGVGEWFFHKCFARKVLGRDAK